MSDMVVVRDNLLPALLFVVGIVLGHYVGAWIGFDISLALGLVGAFLGIYFTYAGFKAWVDKALGGVFGWIRMKLLK